MAIFAGGLVLRLAMVPLAGIYHPDELFQYLEQAHRLLFGHGVVPWEYRLGMRSWLLPITLVPPMALGDRIAPGTSLYLLLPRAMAALLSMTTVWSAWALARRRSALHGLIAAAIAAIWAEFVFLAPHILSESASVALILPAAVLLSDARASSRRLLLAGLLLGFAAVLRMQYGPAIAVLAVLSLWTRPKALMPVVAGGLASLLVSSGIDLAMGQVPFGWLVEYFRQNIVHHRSEDYGVSVYWAYAQGIATSFGWWTVPITLLAAIAARRERVLFRVGLINLVIHMMIPHKEYRFILLTTAILLILAAIGTGDAVAWAAKRWPERRRLHPWIAIALWSISSASLGLSGRAARYAALDNAAIRPYEQLRLDPGLCGLGTYGMPFSAGGGYAYLHRDVPIFSYVPGEETKMRRDAGAFNRLVAPAATVVPSGYRMVSCRAGTGTDPAACIFTRAGGCARSRSDAEINRQLIRTNQ